MDIKKNVALEPDVLEEADKVARAEHKTVDEVANEAIRRYLSLERLHKLQQYGRGRAQELGITEADVPRLIAESRHESRGR